MTLPNVITVKATIGDASGPQAGRIVWHRNLPLLPNSGSDDSYQIPEEVESVVGVDGILEQPLYSTNDPACNPTGWTWVVTTHFPHWKETFAVVVPYDAVNDEINLNQLAPVPPNEDGELYALANHTHAGGGSISYGPVTAQTTYGASSNSGSSDSVSRADHRHGTVALPTPSDIGAAASAHNHAGIYDPAGTAASALAAHTAASDPHPQYLTTAEGGLAYDALGTAAGLLAAHTAAGDPHPQYLTAAEGNAAYDAIGAATSVLAAHTASADPHPQYTVVLYDTAGTYGTASGAVIYVGATTPPGTPPDGSVWIAP